MNASEKRNIALYYPAFLGGGAEAVGLWILEALQKDYNVTLFTVSNVNFEKLNSMYGTQLSKDLIQIKSFFPKSLVSLFDTLISNNSHIRMLAFHLLIRYLKTNQRDYDLLISAYNAADFGRKSIHYVHWIRVLEGNPLYDRISDFSKNRIKDNILIANSQTVATYVQKEYGGDPIVVYPPVVIDTQEIPWEQKEDAFICSGRLTQAKQPHKIIQILKQVRHKGFDVKLYITGGGGGAYAWKYQRFVKKLAQENSAWVTVYENLKYKDYVEVLTKCKYGMHFKEEPFGISIAEMVKAGALPFVRSKGGQIEIVGQQNQDLFFSNEQDAVDKVIAVLSNSEKQQKLVHALKEQKDLFSTQRFITEINQVVENYFQSSSV